MIHEVELLTWFGLSTCCKVKTMKCFLLSEKIPNILHEIGRLREITFREVGEGTNESIDLDKYDQYYHHIFLWDDETPTKLLVLIVWDWVLRFTQNTVWTVSI
jgi:hypothetical protein